MGRPAEVGASQKTCPESCPLTFSLCEDMGTKIHGLRMHVSAEHDIMQDPDLNPWQMLRGYQPFSLCDWPGMISAVLFFGGCNLRCPTCHNAFLSWNPDQTSCLDCTETLGRIARNRKWLDGLVLSGGEVTILPRFDVLLRDLLEAGLPLKLDTNGFRPEAVRKALEYDQVRIIAVDIKGPWDMYPDLSGGYAGPGQAEKCLGEIFELARSCPERFLFRCTRVPALTDKDIQTVRSYLPKGIDLKVQAYMPPRIHQATF